MKKLIASIIISVFLLLVTLHILFVQAQPLTHPTVAAITPNTGPADQQTAVTITGQEFVTTSAAYLDDTALLNVTFVNSATLEARVPFGLPSGVYTLTITSLQTGTLVVNTTLTNAFTVTQGALDWASGGPYGGGTQAIAINPELTKTVYVAVRQSGLYRTTDGGENWELVFHSPTFGAGVLKVWSINPSVIFFGAEDGLYRSNQSGDPGSWSPIDFPGEGLLGQPSALAIAPSDPYTMYCSIGSTLFHSGDGGVIWEERDSVLPGSPWMLAVDTDNAATAYAVYAEEGTLYKTVNAGLLWAQLPYSIPKTIDGEGGIEAIATDPYRNNTLWLGTSMQGLYRSIDGGQAFTEVTSLYTVAHQSWFASISFDPNRDRIYVGTIGPNDAIHYSDDGGGSWHGMGLNNQGGNDIAVVPGDSDTIYTTWSGVRKSTDGGQNWTWLSHGIAAISPIRTIVSTHDPQQAIVVADADGAFGTYNGGNEWITYPVSRSGESHQYRAAAFDPVSPTIAYVGGTETMFKTTDGGGSWQATADMPLDGLPSTYDCARPLFVAVHPQTHTIVYAGVSFFNLGDESINEGALYRSNDSGNSWMRVTATGPISNVSYIAFAPDHPEIIYLGTAAGGHYQGAGIWRSRDGGQTWEHPTALGSYRIPALVVHPHDTDILLAGVWSGSNAGLGVHRSVDGGDSWQPTNGLNHHEECKVLDIVYDRTNAQIVYAATHGGLRISFNGGLSWQPYPGPMGQLPISSLAAFQDGGQMILYVGAVGGTVVGHRSRLQAIQGESVLGAGVYVGYPRWYLVHMPLVLRGSQ